jgi:DNA-binding MarR family transcriptional regulator
MNTSHPVDTLHRLLHAYKRAMREAYLGAGIDLPITHVRVLKGIGYLPACTAQALAKRMQRDKSQITRIVKELRALDLVRSQTDPEDGRNRILTPTDAGKRLLACVAEAEREAGDRMMAGLPPDAVAEFVRLAGIVATNLDSSKDCS